MAGPVQLLESATVGLAVGGAASTAFEPGFELARQHNWKNNQVKVLAADAAARLRAQGLINDADAHDEGAREGFSADKIDALVEMTLSAPGVPELLTLWRRGHIDQTAFDHGMRKAMLESDWDTAIHHLFTDRLDPAVIALGIVRGVIQDPGFLPVTLSTGNSTVPPYPQSTIPALEEAQASGIDRERLRVMVANTGRPSPVQETAHAVFRGIANRDAFNLSILEGDIRPEYADLLFEVAREILTAHDWVELHLRGWITAQQMYAGTALHGMSKADTDLMFKVLGRPLAIHQITTGLARGGVFQPPPDGVQDPYQASVRESNIRPEYYDLAIANRYSYPSLFQLNSLVKANAITADEAKLWAEKDGYAPEVVTALHTFWQGEQATAAAGTTVKPKQFTYSQIHQAWRHQIFTDAQALTELEAIGYPTAKADTLLATWKATPPPAP